MVAMFWGLIFGAISSIIGQRKNLSGGGSFCWGFFLGIIGLIVVIAQKPGLPPAPPGLYATKCPRCNAVQNVPYDAPTFECWQCHLATPLPGTTALAYSTGNPVTSDIKPVTNNIKPVTSNLQTAKAKCLFCGHVQTVPATQTHYMCEKCNRKLKRKIKTG